jgi:hypothetical protein
MKGGEPSMKLSEARYKHLVVTTPNMAEVVGYGFVVNLIATGKEITEIRLLTDEAVQENLMAASRDLKSGKINLHEGIVVSPVSPGKNDGEVVEIDIDQEQAIRILKK